MCLRHMVDGGALSINCVLVQPSVRPFLLYDVIIRFNLCFVLHLGNVGGEFLSSELTQMLVFLLIIGLWLLYVGPCGRAIAVVCRILLLLSSRSLLVLINYRDARFKAALHPLQPCLTLRPCCYPSHQIVVLLWIFVVDKTAEITLVSCILILNIIPPLKDCASCCCCVLLVDPRSDVF